MPWQPTVYSLLAFGAAGISASVAARIWEYRDERGAPLFIGLLLAATGWSAAYGIQLGFTTEAAQLVWQRMAVAIGGSIPTLWVLFAFTYVGRDGWLTPAVRAMLLAQPVTFAALSLTNPHHGLIWDSLVLEETAVGPALVPTFGEGMFLHLGYSYLAILAGLGVLFYIFVRDPTIYRTQTALLMGGAIVPMSVNVAYTFGLSWGPFPALDPTPFSFVITGTLVGLAFFRFDLLTRAPVARQHVLNEMGDGLLVLDTDGQVVDANGVAQQVLDADTLAGHTVGDLLERTALADTATDPPDGSGAGPTLASLDGCTLTTTVDGSEEAYDLQCAALTDSTGDDIGEVLSFRNVTDRNRYEQRLEVTQRVLRHNLRNDMSVIRAHAERLAQNGHTPGAERIVDTTDQLIELSDKTRLITRLDRRQDDTRVPVDVERRLKDITERLGECYPDATVDCEVPAGVQASLPDPALFDIPVENLVENAIVHSDAPDPVVRVDARRADSSVRLRIEDEGPAIPEMELEALEAGTEEPLQHGSSIGLWLAHWSVRTADGDLAFDTGDDGNVVTVEFPATRTEQRTTGGG
jgi:signal transduction histidine kinase